MWSLGAKVVKRAYSLTDTIYMVKELIKLSSNRWTG